MTRLHRSNQRADLGERESPRDECLAHYAVMENWREDARDVSGARYQVQFESRFAKNPHQQWDFEMDRSPVVRLEARAAGRVPPSASNWTCMRSDSMERECSQKARDLCNPILVRP